MIENIPIVPFFIFPISLFQFTSEFRIPLFPISHSGVTFPPAKAPICHSRFQRSPGRAKAAQRVQQQEDGLPDRPEDHLDHRPEHVHLNRPDPARHQGGLAGAERDGQVPLVPRQEDEAPSVQCGDPGAQLHPQLLLLCAVGARL